MGNAFSEIDKNKNTCSQVSALIENIDDNTNNDVSNDNDKPKSSHKNTMPTWAQICSFNTMQYMTTMY